MNESLSQKSCSHPFKNVLIAWVVCFSVGTSWESAFRILAEHTSWGVGQTISFMVNNLVFAVACSVLLAVLHKGLIIVAGWIDKRHFISRKFLSPEIGLAAATLLCMSLWVIRYRFPLKQAPVIVQRSFVFLVLILAYLGCMIFARLLHRHVLSRCSFSLLGKLALLAIFGPTAIACVMQLVRDFRHQSVKPPENAVNYVILISVDSLRWDYVGAYGSSHVRTPVIDQLAAEGALFKHAISLQPETGPSHISMLTGLSPLQHGVVRNGYVLSNDVATLAMYLRESGFQTAGFVSGWPLQVNNCALDRGFRTYDYYFGLIDHFDASYCGRFVRSLPFFVNGLSRDAKSVTDLVLRWLSKNIDSPLFLFVHCYDPHQYYGGLRARNRIKPTRDDLSRERSFYAAKVEQVDAQIGRIVAFLKEKGVYNSTLLIFTADHGESLGEHEIYYQKENLYEDVIRVPLIIRYPQAIKRGTVVSNQVALTDIFRTILNATRLKSKQAPNSFDLIEEANGRANRSTRMIISNSFYKRKVKHAVRTNEWKLIRNDDNQKTYELYNLFTDPTESVNLFSKETEIGRQLEVFLNRELSLRIDRKVEGLSPAQIENLKSLGYIN